MCESLNVEMRMLENINRTCEWSIVPKGTLEKVVSVIGQAFLVDFM